MAGWEEREWTADPPVGAPKRDRRVGRYRAYLPDPLVGRPLTVGAELALLLADAERSVRELGAGPGADSLAAISRFLLRSEAIASSRIEGLAPSPRQVALAELAQDEDIRGISTQAALVANNMTVVRRATVDLVEAGQVTVTAIEELHRSLLPDERLHGLRAVQNWIGGSDWHPIDADFVPPLPEAVPALVTDLVDYLNGAVHSPLVQAGLVHAQFETIHPFADGNGRVGRALIHTVLTRRGLTPHAVLPVSLVLATLRGGYVDGLTAYRHHGQPGSAAAVAGMSAWLTVFAEATQIAAREARSLADAVRELQDDWRACVAAARADAGIRETPRAGSAISRLLTMLPEAPVLTPRSVQRILGVSHPAASAALEELQRAHVLSSRRIERGARAYVAGDVLDLIARSERQLASTRFDTRLSPPSRPVPVRPRGGPRE